MEKIADSDLMGALSKISDIVDQNSTIRFLKDVASRYALNTIAYFAVGVVGQNETDPYLAVTYPPEWVEHYKKRQYVDVDPVVRLGFRRMLPLDWDEFGKPTGRLKTFFGEAGEFGIGRRGLTVPVHGRCGDRALFSVTSDLSARDWASAKLLYMRDFQVLAMHIHDRVLCIEGQASEPASLSPRELECLQWIAEGKTAWECAVILCLSQHTVRCYLESARHKLHATSNTHAVSIAHRAGLLFGPL
ncbi:LuxR family transcriptional regulator [Hoeflea alexandrii]|uniref:LuxR family transcriptional regulator n=1 Tax=Hoeflea alexandrii TaxID=288436 RepID=A0ABT1CXI2_9HYPH|nr:LuxR family transcriptional regulator [Hoeflea alexandrii]MCO6410878.1 LuxR family transcriptional regulator [Hoeflea alexandrii]